MTKFAMRWLVSGAILFALLLTGCSLFQSPEPSPAPTNTPTATPTNMPTPEPATTPTPEPTAIPTAAPTYTPTPEPTATPSPAPTATPTNTPTPEPPATPTTESAADRAALVALYEATDGPNWTNNTKWLSEAHRRSMLCPSGAWSPDRPSRILIWSQCLGNFSDFGNQELKDSAKTLDLAAVDRDFNLVAGQFHLAFPFL